MKFKYNKFHIVPPISLKRTGNKTPIETLRGGCHNMEIGRLLYISHVHSTCACGMQLTPLFKLYVYTFSLKKQLKYFFYFFFSSLQKFYDRLHDRNIHISIYFIVYYNLPWPTRTIFQLYCIGQYYWLWVIGVHHCQQF